ncbi:MAG: hypothetical protein RIC55_01680 [Pirellulaceae bacterium]
MNLPIPGLWWFGGTAVDTNASLGFVSGSYFTVGSKVLLFEDPLSGSWMLESRAHVVEKNGNWFTNVGLERSFYLEPAYTDLGLGVWYDGDFDRPELFGHQFNQIGVSGFMKSPLGDFRVNGYIPVGTTDFVERIGPFVGNRILIPGQDSALTGFDSTYRLRLPAFERIGGFVDVGGYSYRSSLVPAFGGFKMRAGLMSLNGVQLTGEFNHDNVYKSTGFLQLVIAGGSAAPSSSQSGREFEPTPRNDHVMRFHRDRQIAFNPVTGLPYNVIHVDNSVGGPGTGTFEDPFATTALAQGGSAPNDVIFVNSNGIPYGQIVLQNGQFLLGQGVNHPLPLLGGGVFVMQTAGGPLPIIVPAAGTDGVTLAAGPNPNTVAGFQINAAASRDAILASGVTSGAILRDLNLFGGGGITGSGINVMNSFGTFTITNTLIQNFGGPGFNLVNGAPNVNFNGTINNLTNRALQITGTTGGTATFDGTINDSGGTGIQLMNVGGNVNVAATTLLQNSTTNGLDIQGGTGNFTFANLGIMNAVGAGVLINGGSHNTSINFSGTGLQNAAGRAIDIQAMNAGSVTFSGGGIVNNPLGSGILIDNNANTPITFNNTVDVTTAAGTVPVTVTNNMNSPVSFADLDIVTTDATGLLATGNSGVFSVGTGSILVQNVGGGGTALQVANSAVNLNFFSTIASNSTGAGFGVNLMNLTGTTNLGVAQITTTGPALSNNTGIFAQNAGTILSSVGSTVTSTNAGAVNITGSTTNMNFSTITSSGTPAANTQGIALSSLGAGSTFNVLNQASISGNTSHAILVQNSTGTTVTFNRVVISMNAAGAHGINLFNNDAASTFTLSGGASTIDMMSAVGSSGVNIQNSRATITNATISNIAAGLPNAGINVIATGGGTSTVLLSANTVTNTINNNAIQLSSTGNSVLNATVTSNSLVSTGFNALSAMQNTGLLHLNASNNSNGAAAAPGGGFFLQSLSPTFNVTQLSNPDLSTQNFGVIVGEIGTINYNAGTPPLP